MGPVVTGASETGYWLPGKGPVSEDAVETKNVVLKLPVDNAEQNVRLARPASKAN